MADTTMITPGGRTVGFSAWGDPMSERLVLLCHPTPGTGVDPEPVITGRWGVHLVGLERPGYGASPALEDGVPSTVRDRASDVDEFVRRIERNAHLISQSDFKRYGIIGWGAGAVVAAAVAAADPDRVDRLALVAPLAPDRALQEARAASGRPIDLESMGIRDDDADLARHLGLLDRLDRMAAESAVQGTAGVRHDEQLFADQEWMSRLGGVRADTAIWLGDRDPVATEEDARWYASRIRGVQGHRVRDSGPLVIAAAWSSILEHVAPLHGTLPEGTRDSGSVRLADVDFVHPERG